MAVIGETIEDDENEVNGIVLNIRKQAYRVGIWTKDCDESKLKTVGERLKKVLQLKDEQKSNSCPMMLPTPEVLNHKLSCNFKGIESFYIYIQHIQNHFLRSFSVSSITYNMNTYKLTYIYIYINIKSKP